MRNSRSPAGRLSKSRDYLINTIVEGWAAVRHRPTFRANLPNIDARLAVVPRSSTFGSRYSN